MTTSNFTFSFRLKIFPFIFFLLMGNILFAQVPTIQDCLGAIPICTEIYSETNSPTGSGNYPNEINGISFPNGISCMGDESNSIWYTFTVNQSGDFGFTLTPNNSSDDYDWALFDITNKECEDIFTDISMQVSCNAAGGGTDCTGPTGANGLSAYNVQGFNCNNNPPTQFDGFSSNNAFVPVLIGRTYVLCVSNWTGSTFGYTIDFGVSNDIGIFDNIFPEISDMETPEDCDGEEFIVTFSENIQCNTIDGGNFEIIGTGGPYIATVTSDNCTQGGLYDNVFTVSISPPISEPGNFSITLVSDGVTEVLDLCDNPSTISSFDFEIINVALSDLNIGNDTTLCDGEILTLDATQPNSHTYEWQNGSTNPSIQISQSGNYSVTVTNPCNTLVDNININFVPQQVIDVDLGADTMLCPGELFQLVATTTTGISYVWQDGFEGPIYTVSEAGFYEVMITGACGEMGSAMIEVLYDESQLDLNLGVDTLVCEKDGLYILDASTPNATNYSWGDGSTNSSLQVSESGQYAVTVSDNCNVEIDSIAIEFTNCTICEFYIPNAFSPDFNGYNDIFQAYSNCELENFSMKIFNRWGALVFESKNANTGWDGMFKNKVVPEGVYVYLVEFEVNQKSEILTKKISGDVTVVK